MPDQDNGGDEAAERLERALERIEFLARRPRRAGESSVARYSEVASRLDALIARLDAALTGNH